MERIEFLKKRFSDIQKAHARFKESIEMIDDFNNTQPQYIRSMRNSAIKSFEFTIDPFWKFLRMYLLEVELVNIKDPGPRATYRKAEELALISPEETGLFIQMIEDRNQAAHDYNEFAIEEIKDKLPQYCDLIGKLLMRLKFEKE